jgi:hypothetical protein
MQEHRNHVAAKLEGSPSFPQITNRSIPRRNSPLLANLLATRSPCLPPWYAARSQSQKTLLLARLGRIALTQIDLRRPTSEPLEKVHYRDCHFMRHVAHFWTANESRSETKTRTLPTIDAKPESENRQSVCRRSAKKQDPPHGQETHRLAQTKPTVSTQSRGGPSAILFSCHFPIAPKLGRRAPISKFTYCRHSRKIPARPSHRREP